ncbi:MAG TPA: hypothetical protein ENH94_08890 [Phycisphaerales bacterium]|nr:hypothetical protein [Phycisphaerales bacterium]
MKKDVVSTTKNMKNKANFNSVKFTATSYNTVVYNASQPKPKNGTKPNKANPKPILARRPPGVVTSTKTGNSANLQKLFFAKRTQFRQPNSTATACNKVTYNALRPKGNEPKRTQLKPIKANPNPIISRSKPTKHENINSQA